MLLCPLVRREFLQPVTALRGDFEIWGLAVQIGTHIRVIPTEEFNPLVGELYLLAVLEMPLCSHVARHDGVDERLLVGVLVEKIVDFIRLGLTDHGEAKLLQDADFRLHRVDSDNTHLLMNSLDALVLKLGDADADGVGAKDLANQREKRDAVQPSDGDVIVFIVRPASVMPFPDPVLGQSDFLGFLQSFTGAIYGQ